MSENLMCLGNKATNETYRTEYDRIFRGLNSIHVCFTESKTRFRIMNGENVTDKEWRKRFKVGDSERFIKVAVIPNKTLIQEMKDDIIYDFSSELSKY